MLQFFGCIAIDTKPQQHSLLDRRPSAGFSGKMHAFLRSLADFLLVLAFLLCYFIFDSYVVYLTLSFHIVYVNFNLHNFFVRLQSLTVLILATFKCILNQSRCSLEPKNFLMGASPLKPPPRGSEHLRPSQPPSSVDGRYTWFSADYVYSWDHVCLMTIVGFKLKILSKTI